MMRERDWYGKDWKILRTQLIKLSLLHSEALLEGFKDSIGNIETLLDPFIEQILLDISERISLDQIGLWQNCLPLFVQCEWFYAELKRDREVLCGRKNNKGKKMQPRQALARKLALFFEMNRRGHIANELGVSSNKVKTWERLDKISRNIVKNQTISNRCSEEHFDELASYVKINHGHDKNLPRRAKTVKGYFYRFSEDCFENIESRDDTMDKLSFQETKNLLQKVGMTELSRCLNELSASELEIIDVSFKLDMGKVVYRSVDDYLFNHQLTHDHFLKQQQKVINKLRQCFEIGLVARQGGHA